MTDDVARSIALKFLKKGCDGGCNPRVGMCETCTLTDLIRTALAEPLEDSERMNEAMRPASNISISGVWGDCPYFMPIHTREQFDAARDAARKADGNE